MRYFKSSIKLLIIYANTKGTFHQINNYNGEIFKHVLLIVIKMNLYVQMLIIILLVIYLIGLNLMLINLINNKECQTTLKRNR
jgi:hypothetical protein